MQTQMDGHTHQTQARLPAPLREGPFTRFSMRSQGNSRNLTQSESTFPVGSVSSCRNCHPPRDEADSNSGAGFSAGFWQLCGGPSLFLVPPQKGGFARPRSHLRAGPVLQQIHTAHGGAVLMGDHETWRAVGLVGGEAQAECVPTQGFCKDTHLGR